MYSLLRDIPQFISGGNLEWYLQLNSGGTVHTEDELARVRLLLKEEKLGLSKGERS
jgi:hypothetical protein